jgi:hypothetical protein
VAHPQFLAERQQEQANYLAVHIISQAAAVVVPKVAQQDQQVLAAEQQEL